MKSFCLTSFHYANHRAPWSFIIARGAGFQAFTNRVLVRPVMLRRLFADDHTACSIDRVPVVELPPAHKRDAHRAEIAGADGAVDYIRPLIRRRIRDAFDRNAHRVTVVGERQVTRDGDRLCARQGQHAPNNFIEECRPPCRVRVFHF